MERVLTGEKLIEATREHFIKEMSEGKPVHEFFPYHVGQVEKWALKILEFYPEADREIVLLSVWLHDVGQKNEGNHDKHELISEKAARKFLPTLGLSQERIDKVAHCVRTHRCKAEAMPETTEAKILAAADSASHITDIFYIIMLNQGKSKKEVLEKLQRDIRDVQSLPDILKKQLVFTENAWKELINTFPEQ
jgi:HD superfamily phosphodiesterase